MIQSSLTADVKTDGDDTQIPDSMGNIVVLNELPSISQLSLQTANSVATSVHSQYADIQTDVKTDDTQRPDSIGNIAVLNELPSISQLSLQSANSVATSVDSQYPDIQTPRLLSNTYTPKSTLSDMSNISHLPSISPLPPSTMPQIISTGQRNNYSGFQRNNYHYMPYNYHSQYPQYHNSHTSHTRSHYSTNQISCPGKDSCRDKDCVYGHAAAKDRQNGQYLFCERILDCRYGNRCSRNHRITWDRSQPPKELKCPYYYNRKHRGYCKGYKALKCPYFHGQVRNISKQTSSLTVSSDDYVIYSHGKYCIDRQICDNNTEVYGRIAELNKHKSYVVIRGNEIIMDSKTVKNHWFFMCIGTAVFDGLLQLPVINHYCIVWHQDCKCWKRQFDVHDLEKCEEEYNRDLKGYARAIICNGKPIKQTILAKNGNFEIENGVNEWLKSAIGSYYYTF